MATNTRTVHLRAETREQIQRERIERLRRVGRYRELVLWMLGEPEPLTDEGNGWMTREVRARPLHPTSMRPLEPTSADLQGARLESSDPLPAPIADYLLKYFGPFALPRKTGAKGSTRTRTTEDDERVLEYYDRAHLAAIDAHEADGGPGTRNVKTRAIQQTAKKFQISKRTVETIIAARVMLKGPPK